MVKNKGGGNRGKKVARKLVNANNRKQKLRVPNNEFEILAAVNKLEGGRNMTVNCIDGVLRQCVIRKKFSGRSKRDNFIKTGVWVLIGIREYSTKLAEGVTKNGKPKLEVCDLLEVYKDTEVNELQETIDCDFSPLLSEIEQEINNDIKFVDEETQELQEITEQKQAAQQQQMEMMNAVQESQVAKNVAPAVQALDEANRQQ